jgi:hypothetical protein
MKRSKLLIVALIGLLMAVGLVMAGCDDKKEECPRISATGEECYYYPGQYLNELIPPIPPSIEACTMPKCGLHNGGSKCNC